MSRELVIMKSMKGLVFGFSDCSYFPLFQAETKIPFIEDFLETIKVEVEADDIKTEYKTEESINESKNRLPSETTASNEKKSHSGKPHVCSKCGKAYARKQGLNIHTRTHTGIKTYKCDVCGKEFAYKSGFDYHSKTHTGQKPHKCDFCGKEFILKSSLVYHTRTHTGEKPYNCDVCPKAFIQKAHLDNHRKYHTGEGSHKCQDCGKCFTSKSGLAQHLRSSYRNRSMPVKQVPILPKSSTPVLFVLNLS